ncbi:MAG: 6-phosphogluconolactonase [Thermomicrobium sp.]|nr:6-phosphogluconolactonase [Thermomicrobium sp.]
MPFGLRVLDDDQAAAREAAELWTTILRTAIERFGRATVALAGGRTPRLLYETLAGEPYRERVAWDLVEWFWGDERPVPADHPDSNYRLAAETLLSRLPVAPARMHRIPTELGPEAAARAYEDEIRRVFGLTPHELPRFDLILLGMGADGHIASIFPATAAVRETARLVIAVHVPHLATTRITLTPPVIRVATHVLVLVTGAEKAPAVRAALEDPDDPDRIPAHILRSASGDVIWLLDRAAARDLSRPTGSPPT